MDNSFQAKLLYLCGYFKKQRKVEVFIFRGLCPGKGERADKQAAGNLKHGFCVFLIKSIMDKFRSYTERWSGGT